MLFNKMMEKEQENKKEEKCFFTTTNEQWYVYLNNFLSQEYNMNSKELGIIGNSIEYNDLIEMNSLYDFCDKHLNGLDLLYIRVEFVTWFVSKVCKQKTRFDIGDVYFRTDKNYTPLYSLQDAEKDKRNGENEDELKFSGPMNLNEFMQMMMRMVNNKKR